ncbi:hypothetical protein G9A89_003694 [Geosiphon pyriformis]|nr:hypothetical protein G9A89_003694 [Geosiphon pyriformis]
MIATSVKYVKKELGILRFGAIYKATWIDGRIDSISIKHYGAIEYKRIKYIDGKEVAIKFVKTSLQNDEKVFKENGYMSAYISYLIGITPNPETLEHGIGMNFASVNILDGIRPEIISPLIPYCIAELIEKCWDVNPLNRPSAKGVNLTLENLHNLYYEGSN